MMNEAAAMQMKTALSDMTAHCKARELQLAAAGRTDESIHARIARNVYEAFTAVFDAACRQADPEAFFRARLTQIPANWIASRETALAHGDDEKAYIESIKLKAASEVEEAFRRTTEG